MAFLHQRSPLFRLLRKGRQINFITVLLYVYLADCKSYFPVSSEFELRICFTVLQDGIWSTLKGSFTIIRDFLDVCYHSYFSIMDDLRRQGPSEGKYYEIRSVFLSATS